MAEKQKLGQEPAFPIEEHYEGNYGPCINFHPGMSKRLLIAKDVLCALSSNAYFSEKIGELNTEKINMIPTIVKMSFEYADELLKQEGA